MMKIDFGRLATIVGALLLIIAAGPAWAQRSTVEFSPNLMGQITFVMPSFNIECTYTPEGGTLVYRPFDGGPELSCDRRELHYLRFVLTPKSLRRFDHVGDQGCCGVDNVLTYGARWSRGPFTCISAASGLRCMRKDGRGFVIGRKHARRL